MNTAHAPAELMKTLRMTEFRVSNDLLGNRTKLDAAWERDGYWFFRDVLDQSAISRLHSTYLGVLKDVGAIADEAMEAIHNGSSLADYPITRHDKLYQDPLFLLNPMTQFVAEPAIRDFFKRLIDDEPVWLPVTEYHAVPPHQDQNRSRFNFIHRDSTTNPCIPVRINNLDWTQYKCVVDLIVAHDGRTESGQPRFPRGQKHKASRFSKVRCA